MPDSIASFRIDGVEILSGPVSWPTSHIATAQAFARAINNGDAPYIAETQGANIIIVKAGWLRRLFKFLRAVWRKLWNRDA